MCAVQGAAVSCVPCKGGACDGVRVGQKLDAIWARYDTDGDGFISPDEFRAALLAECRVANAEVCVCVRARARVPACEPACPPVTLVSAWP